MKTFNKQLKNIDYLKDFDLLNNKKNNNYILKYIADISIYKSPITVRTYSACIKNFYEYLTIECKYKTYLRVNRKTLENYIVYLNNKKLGPDTIHARIMATKSYFKFLLKNKAITTESFFELFDGLTTPKIIIKKQLLIKANDTIEITNKMPSKKFSQRRNILMLLLMSNTGIRRKEIANIDVKNININNNTITIYKTKGDKPRIVSFSESIKEQLINYLEERENILKKYKINNSNFIIKSNGETLSINTISNIMKIISKKLNKKVTCHSLRRGFATDMAEGGTDIHVISKMLGHSNINTTVSRYIYVLMSMIKDAMENHPFSKENKNIKTFNNNFNSLEDKVLIKNMFEDITNKMNELLNYLPNGASNIKKA